MTSVDICVRDCVVNEIKDVNLVKILSYLHTVILITTVVMLQSEQQGEDLPVQCFGRANF